MSSDNEEALAKLYEREREHNRYLMKRLFEAQDYAFALRTAGNEVLFAWKDKSPMTWEDFDNQSVIKAWNAARESKNP